MLFERFLKKRIPIKRSQARLNTGQDSQPPAPPQRIVDQASLAEQVRHPDPAQRREALAELLDLALVRQCLDTDTDAGVRELAARCYRQLLLAPATPEHPSPETRLAELQRLPDADIPALLARECPLPEVRRAAIAQIDDPQQLAHCALHDGVAANRHQAVERLEDRAALEQVARQIGKRDKTVYRSAREKLRAIAEREQRPQRIREQCHELCEKAERLGHLNNWTQDRALLDHLDQQWGMIAEEAEPEYQSRYRAARERFLAAHAEHLVARQVQHTPAPVPDAEPAPAASEVEASPPSEPEPTTSAPPPAAPEIDLDRQRARLLTLCARAESLRDEPRALDARQSQALIERGRALAEMLPDDAEERVRFENIAERLASRLTHQHKHARQRLAHLAERLAELEVHLEAGELRKADPLYQSLQASLDLVRASGLTDATGKAVAERLHELAPELRELHQWRRWSADQHREQLCAEIEALLTQEMPLDALSERLHSLRKDWKTIDNSGARANQALWERFHQAAEQLHERCRPFIEAQAVEREANRQAREALCEQIETFLEQVDWERVSDWKKLLHAERDMRRAWKATGMVEARHHRALTRRFHQSIRQLEKHLDSERKRNLAQRKELIAQVEALIEEPDLERAINATKAIQRQWHPTVPARQKDEHRLWQRFRGACDAVFARRAAQHHAQAEEFRQNLAQQESVLKAARECLDQARDSRQLARDWREIEQRWREAHADPIPRSAQQDLLKRWQAIRHDLEQRRRTLKAAEQHLALEQLERQAALCERLENAALEGKGGALDREAVHAEWQSLPTQEDESLQTAIEARFQAALAALDDPARSEALRAAHQAHGEAHAQLCLQLEILAGLDSPPEFTQQRLEYQVTRLAERMGEGEADPLHDAAQLLQRWYLSAPAPTDPGLIARFRRIREAVEL